MVERYTVTVFVVGSTPILHTINQTILWQIQVYLIFLQNLQMQ